MLLPNKLFSYSETTLPLLPQILNRLDEPCSPKELASLTNNPTRLIDALDCLFALGMIRIDTEGRLHTC